MYRFSSSSFRDADNIIIKWQYCKEMYINVYCDLLIPGTRVRIFRVFTRVGIKICIDVIRNKLFFRIDYFYSR